MKMRAALALLFSLVGACPKPGVTNPPKEPAVVVDTRSLKDLMLAAQEQANKASGALSDPAAFSVAAGEVAGLMRAVRDFRAPDPGFYQLADDSYRAATQSASEAPNPEKLAQRWEATQKTCQSCHLRYGGPAGEGVSLIDSLRQSNP